MNMMKDELEKIYNNIAECVKICSKRSWYQYNEKCIKLFFGLEKRNALCRTIKMLDSGKEITTPHEISLI